MLVATAILTAFLCTTANARSNDATECPTAPNPGGDRRVNKNTLRLMQYNVDWLFTNYSHSIGSIVCPGECDWKNVSIAELHLQTVANYIISFNPDIVVMEEVSDCWVLQQLIAAMPTHAQVLYRPYLVMGTDTSTGQNVGMITKIDPIQDLMRSDDTYPYPIEGSQCGYTQTGHHSSCTQHFRTRFDIPGLDHKLTLLGVHFISQPTDPYRCAKREAQATLMAKFLSDAVANNDEIIVTGDFNDYDDSVVDAIGDVPTSTATKIIRTVKEPNLINAVSLIDTQSDRYSDWWDRNDNCVETDNEHTLIDHMFVSSTLFNKIDNVTLDHSYGNECGCLYSDHWPIIVDFDLS